MYYLDFVNFNASNNLIHNDESLFIFGNYFFEGNAQIRIFNSTFYNNTFLIGGKLILMYNN